VGVVEPMLLQRAVSPPLGWAGVSVRILAQRDPEEGWHLAPAVARRDRTEAVVNAHRGAEVAPAMDIVVGETLSACHSLARRVCDAFDATLGSGSAIELGVDVVIDAIGRAHLIEVNGRPQGRLRVLAEVDPDRFEPIHRRVIERPLRYLAHLHCDSLKSNTE
jgi:hypothetical protein